MSDELTNTYNTTMASVEREDERLTSLANDITALQKTLRSEGRLEEFVHDITELLELVNYVRSCITSLEEHKTSAAAAYEQAIETQQAKDIAWSEKWIASINISLEAIHANNDHIATAIASIEAQREGVDGVIDEDTEPEQV